MKLDINYYFGNILLALLIWIGSLGAIFLLPIFIVFRGCFGLWMLGRDWWKGEIEQK